jgi:hypothetical protein
LIEIVVFIEAVAGVVIAVVGGLLIAEQAGTSAI